MRTLWRWIDKNGVLHLTSDIDEAERGMKENKLVLGELLHE